MPEKFVILDRSDTALGAQKIAYMQQGGRAPGIVFCGGFRSDMTGTKAAALAKWSAARGTAYLRFDWFGHGQSSGDFLDGTISHWRGDLPHILENLTEDPQILVGSSFGGWMATLAALDCPARIAALVLIAPAIDMTERLMWQRFSPDTRAKLMSEGLIYDPSEYDAEGYPITRALIEDGRKHLLLHKNIALDMPVRILHGQRDDAVPWELSLEFAARLQGRDVELHFIKNGDHRLSAPPEIDRLTALIESVS